MIFKFVDISIIAHKKSRVKTYFTVVKSVTFYLLILEEPEINQGADEATSNNRK